MKEINQMRVIMTNTEHDEKLAVRIITDYLKEEKNIQIKNARHLTQGEDPPDYYFEIGNHKIGCEIRHFNLIDELSKEEGNNLAKEADIRHKIIEEIKQSLQETGIPPFIWSMNFSITQPIDISKKAEKIVNAITTMHKESITQSEIYIRDNPEKYDILFVENDISSIEILYTDPLDGVNIDEKYHCGAWNISTRPYKTIKAEEMQAVIDKKDKDIPNYKEHYDQKWLIITNYETIDCFTLKGAAKETQYKHNFDKVLCIQMSWIEPKIRKQKGIGPLTDLFAVCELKRLNQ